MIRRHTEPFRWEEVDLLPYKEDGTHFKSISRQTLFRGDHGLPVELRYFEMQPDGYSTLERHEHEHLVMVFRGSGHVFVGDKVFAVAERDVVHIPAMTWHQFRATQGVAFGFLCVVTTDRDRPQRPAEADLEHLRSSAEVAAFIRI